MKNKKLNKLLMAASSLAILAGGATSAMAAANYITTGTAVDVGLATGIRNAANAVGGAGGPLANTALVTAGDKLFIAHNNTVIKYNNVNAGNAVINLFGNNATIEVSNANSTLVDLLNDYSATATVDATAANGGGAVIPANLKEKAKLAIKFTGNNTLSYALNDDAKIARVGSVDFSNTDGILKFVAASNGKEIKNSFKGTGANGRGTIEIDAGTAITLSGTFDKDQRVKGLKLDATNSKAIINTYLYLGTDGISFTGDAAEVVVNKGKIVDVEKIATTANSNGILTFEGDATVLINDGKIADIAGDKLAKIELKDGVVKFTKDIAHKIGATEIHFTKETSGLAFDNNKDVTIVGGKAGITIATDGAGKIVADNLAGKTLTVTGKIGDTNTHLGLISAQKGGTISLITTNAEGQYIKKIETAGATDVTLQLKAGAVNANAAAVYKIADFSHSDNVGTLKIASADPVHIVKLAEGTVLSTDKNRLKAVEFASNGNNATLEFGKNVSLHTEKGITTITANEGSLLFGEGEHVVAGTVGTKDKSLNVITSNFASNKVTFTDNVYSSKIIFGANSNETSAITFGKNTTEVIVGNAAGITNAANANNGVLAFANDKPLVIDAQVIGANANALKAISIEGNNVTSKNLTVLTTQEIRFVGENSTAILDISENKINLADAKIITETTNRSNHIIVKGDQVIGGEIGASNKAFGEIRVKNGAANATVGFNYVDAKNVYASLVPTDKDQIIDVTLGNAVSILGLGAKDRMLNTVTRLAGDKFENKGDTYVKTFTVEDAKTYTLGGTIQTGTDNGQGLILDGENAAVIFADNAVINGLVVATNDAEGIVRFDGSATLNAQLGDAASKLGSIKFSDEEKATVKIQNDVYAIAADAGKSTIDFSQKDRAFNAPLALAGTKLELGTSNIKFTEAVSIKDAMTLEVHATNDKAGRMTLVNGVVADPTVADEKVKISINLVDDSDLVSGKTYTIIENDAKATTKVDFVENADEIDIDFKSEGQRFTNWNIGVEQDKIIVTSSNNVAGALTEITKGLEGVNAEYITAFANSAGSDVVRGLGQLPTDADIRKAVQQLTTTTNQTATNIATASTFTNIINNRASSVSAVPVQLTEVGAGISAGDELSPNYGAWMMPFMGKSHQKKSGSIAGYNAKTKGGVIGGDAQVNDGLVLGAAFGLSDSKVKHKDIKAGDKTDSKMKMVSIYGTQRLNDNMFVQGMIGYGWGNVTNKEGRTEAEGDAANRKAVNKIAVGKYKNKVSSVEVLGGYDYRIDSVTITPMVGVGYSKFNDGGYTETGTINQNKTIAKRKLDKVEGIVGIRLASTQDFSGVITTPEVHAFTRISNSKSPNVKTTLSGVADQLVIKGAKQSKAVYNLGTSVTAKSGNFDYGVGYDLTKSKAVDHTTYLKLRVNF